MEFFTADGLVWPVVMRLSAKGVVAASADGSPASAPAPLAEALDQLMELLATATPTRTGVRAGGIGLFPSSLSQGRQAPNTFPSRRSIWAAA